MEITSDFLMSSQGLKLLKNLFISSGEGIMFIDAGGCILTLNPRAEEMFGYTEEELRGEPIEKLVPAPFRKHHQSKRNSYLKAPEARRMGAGRDLSGLKKDGTVFPLEVSLSYFMHDNEGIVVAFVTDISVRKQQEDEIRNQQVALEQQTEILQQKVSERTKELEHMNLGLQSQIQERKMAEKALKKSLQELRRAEIEIVQAYEKEKELGELKSRFVSMASHEFRTPLTTILSSANLIARYSERNHQESREKHIGRIRTAVQNLTAILNDFLSLEKVESGKISVNEVHFHMRPLCNEILEEIRPILKKGQKIKAEIEDCAMISDQHLIKNIMLNLLSNARKYSNEGDTIFFQVQEEGHQVRVIVRDEGIGIPEDEQSGLFNRFFRAANVTNIPGTGLGLNILKSYVDLLGGMVTFESKEGFGTTFTVILPKALDNPNESKAKDSGH